VCVVGGDHRRRRRRHRHRQNGYAPETFACWVAGQGRATLEACQANLGEEGHLLVEDLEEEVLAILEETNQEVGRAAGILDRHPSLHHGPAD